MVTGLAAWKLTQAQEVAAQEERAQAKAGDGVADGAKGKEEETVASAPLHMDLIRLELGYGLLGLAGLMITD